MRVGIIGCGKVADKHLSQIRRIPGAEVVAACDREPLMTAQLAERFAIPARFADAGEMLATARPDVVHITTPPASHHTLGIQCLEGGCHVYMEKPFTLNHAEAVELVELATRKGLCVTVGHETQFMHVARDMRALIHAGYLGGPPVHMESTYCYDFSDERYARAMLGDRNHWVRRLPGGLLQNIISHGIGKIVEYLPADVVDVRAQGFTSSVLQGMGEHGIIDELRVMMVDLRATTAYFTFSSQVGAGQHRFAIHGPRNGLAADHERQVLARIRRSTYRSYLNQFVPPFEDGLSAFASGFRNMGRFLRRDFHAEHGMYYLITAFYAAITTGAAPPVPYRDILLTARIMDDIFAQIAPTARAAGATAQALPPRA